MKDLPESPFRPEVTTIEYRFLTYQDVDHVPDREFGFWPQTIRRWLDEGLDVDLTGVEKREGHNRKVFDFFGFESPVHAGVGLRAGMMPLFEEEVLERKGDLVLMRGMHGQVAECYLDDTDNSSIPHYVSFPVSTRDDWDEMKQRFRLDDPARAISEEEIAAAKKKTSSGAMFITSATGPYGFLRDLMGFETLSISFYEQPDLVHEIVEHCTALILGQIRRLPEDLPIDFFGWWEDMASKNGPFVSPAMFRDFLQPCYHAVMEEVRKRGCVLSSVDCDGNPHDLVPIWLNEGVNLVYPMEIAAGADPVAWRKEFGMELRLQGGVDKRALATGRPAIDAELQRLRPLIEEGGFIPHVDHLVPPDVSFADFCYYLEQKRKLLGVG